MRKYVIFYFTSVLILSSLISTLNTYKCSQRRVDSSPDATFRGFGIFHYHAIASSIFEQFLCFHSYSIASYFTGHPHIFMSWQVSAARLIHLLMIFLVSLEQSREEKAIP